MEYIPPDVEPEIEQVAEFLRHFNDESERGAALTAGAMLEDRLGDILSAFLIEGNEADQLLTGFNAPLGTLSARISSCLALGLIDDEEHAEMQTIRKIRNKFAHNWKGVTFESQSIADYCSTLPWRGPDDREEGSTARARFNGAVSLLMVDLLWRVRLVKRERRESRSWPNRARGRSSEL